jgi:hypothetical protein
MGTDVIGAARSGAEVGLPGILLCRRGCRAWATQRRGHPFVKPSARNLPAHPSRICAADAELKRLEK